MMARRMRRHWIEAAFAFAAAQLRDGLIAPCDGFALSPRVDAAVDVAPSSSSVRDRSRCPKRSTSALFAGEPSGGARYSTLTLLEHVNLNVPDHKYALPFYVEVLGMGLDPRRAQNVAAGSGTVWANCGPSQFHLPHGDPAQRLRGHIGLRYESLEGLKRRLAAAEEEASSGDDDRRCFDRYEVGFDGGDKEYVTIVDRYGNVFVAREKQTRDHEDVAAGLRQPVVTQEEASDLLGPDLAKRYGTRNGETDCRGIDYVEFFVPPGTVERIGVFYDAVFDADTTIFAGDDGGGGAVCVVGIGRIDSDGRAEQCLLFRETDEAIPPYDGHHVALYVGRDAADFAVAFNNCMDAGVVWVNPRFSDKSVDLRTAKQNRQFRFKDITDLRDGKAIFTLEHEVRCVDHDAWPGS